ncbi:hypothetical protein FRB90_004868 [Tulasnella sp. 427]|nr:hypothetical protein FRB90_004868 [Tulasnella sp. 427]
MTPTGAGLPICLDINISLASQDLQPRETRKLAFSKLMENWYLSPLLTYSLAHPGKESTSQEPLKRQAMDAIYLRSVDEGRRVWVPLDFWHKMTVRECVARIKSCPDTEIRFISCKFRFVLVTLNDKASNKAVERIIDLKKDGKILLKVLKGRKMRQSAPTLDVKDKDKTGKDGARQYHELATDPTALPITFAAAGAAVRMRVDSAGRAKKFDTKDALRELEPRTWLELYGPDLFATYSAQKVNLLIKFFSRFK